MTLLSKMVARNWRIADTETKSYCHMLAKVDQILVKECAEHGKEKDEKDSAIHQRVQSFLEGRRSEEGKDNGKTSNGSGVDSTTAAEAPRTTETAFVSPSSDFPHFGTPMTMASVIKPASVAAAPYRKRPKKENGVPSSRSSIGGVVTGGATSGLGVASAIVAGAHPPTATADTVMSSGFARLGATTTNIMPEPSVAAVVTALERIRARAESGEASSRKSTGRTFMEGVTNGLEVASVDGAPPPTETAVVHPSSGQATQIVPKPSVADFATALFGRIRTGGEACVEARNPTCRFVGEAANGSAAASAAMGRLYTSTDTGLAHVRKMMTAGVPYTEIANAQNRKRIREENSCAIGPFATAETSAATLKTMPPSTLFALELKDIQVNRYQSEKWEQQFLELENFIKYYGNPPPHNCQSNPALGIWVKDQMLLYNSNGLSEERTKRLRQLGFQFELPSNDPGKRWEQFYLELVKYSEEHGNANVPQNYELNPQLANWVMQVRENYKNGELTEFRTACLWQLDFQFENEANKHGQHEKWDQRYREFAQYVEQHRKLVSHAELQKDASVSTLYNTNPECYRELTRYVDQQGNADTPRSYKSRPKLDKWLKRQRKYYKKGKLTEEQTTRLRELGFQI